MKILKKLPHFLLFACLSIMMGCGSDDDQSNFPNAPGSPSGQQGEAHTYNITINNGSTDERNISGEIPNVFGSSNTGSDFSAYSSTENAKLMVLHLSNSEIVINGLFYHTNNGNTADLGVDEDNKSSIILTFSPPSSDIHQSVSGSVELTNIEYEFLQAESGIVGYTLNFNGNFQDIDDNLSQISGTFVVNLPNLL